MPSHRRPTNDGNQSLLEVGPFGGIDTTTEPYYVSKTNFVDMQNLLPNKGYGGYVTAAGRQVFLANSLPGICRGFQKFSRPGIPNGYIFACDVGGVGALYYAVQGGTPTALSLPSGTSLSSEQQFSFAVYQTWCFITNGVDTPLKVDESLNVTRWGIDAPLTAPTLLVAGSSTMVGTYYYTITFGNSVQESGQGFNPTTQQTVFSLPITVSNQGIALTGIPVSTDPQVTKRNIYRLGGGNGTWNLVGTINDNTTTTYTDTLADGDVKQVLVVFRQPPPLFRYIQAHQGCIFGYGVDATPNTLYFSNFDEPWGFNLTVQSFPVGNGSHNDSPVGMASTGSILALVNKDSLYALFGNSISNFAVEYVERTGGTSSTGVISAYGSIWWISQHGVYVWAGSNAATCISDGGFQKSNIKSVLDGLTTADKAACVLFFYDRMICVSFPTINKTYVYDMRTDAWFPLTWATDQAYSDPNGTYKMLGQNLEAPGEIDLWFAAPGDFGTAITAFITSGITDSGAMYAEKTYRYVQVEAQPQNAILAATITANPGSSQYQYTFAIPITTGGPVFQFSVPMEIVGRAVQLNVSIISADEIHVSSAAIYGEVRRMFVEKDV